MNLPRPLPGCALALIFSAAFTGPAFARGEGQTPPPSGVVIHLFGPDSVTTHFLSPGPGGDTKPGTAGGAGGASASPSWHDIMHQMFVTGDPAQEGPAALSKGKNGK